MDKKEKLDAERSARHAEMKRREEIATAAMMALIGIAIVFCFKLAFSILKGIVRMIPPTYRFLRDAICSRGSYSEEDMSMSDAARFHKSGTPILLKPFIWYGNHIKKASYEISQSEPRMWFMILGSLSIIAITPGEARYGAAIIFGIFALTNIVDLIKFKRKAYQIKTK